MMTVGSKCIVQGLFKIGNPHSDISYRVSLYQYQLSWWPHTGGGEDLSELENLRTAQILNLDENNAGGIKVNGLNETTRQNLTIMYACGSKKEPGKLSLRKLILYHESESVINSWKKELESILRGMVERPKKLLIFTNPFGGKKKGLSIFEKQVKPLLVSSGVKYTMISTEYQNHAVDYIKKMPEETLVTYDLAVAVGGDGTIGEVVRGLLERNLNRTENVCEKDLKASTIGVAVIPAGSSNALAFSLFNTGDPCTAAINLIFGHRVPLDVCTVSGKNGIERFIVGQTSYGHLADTVQYSESFRWLGPKRYDFAGFLKFLKHCTYKGRLEILTDTDDNDRTPKSCDVGKKCQVCTDGEEQWPTAVERKQLMGSFIGISAANISCKCDMSPQGMAPFAHLSDGRMELILIKKTSRLNHLRYLLKTAHDSTKAFSLPFVERHCVKEFVFRPFAVEDENPKTVKALSGVESKRRKFKNLKKSLWNCDGELHDEAFIRVTVNRNLLQVVGPVS